MKLYNSLTRDYYSVPVGEHIKMYSCGPTVYDTVHVGNLFAFIVADTMRRVLATVGSVTHVMNITDIDDKTITRSVELYPDIAPEDALSKLTSQMSMQFMADIEAVGIDTSSIEFIAATNYIPHMQNMIRKIVDAGIGYIADDGIYLSLSAYTQKGFDYGHFSTIEQSGADAHSRINSDEYDKDSAQDSALWKAQKEGEPAWDFTINGQNIPGRPGWHIECSAMAFEHLGENFHIHTGGVDLQFPHHENEIAQARAAGNNNLAQCFAHNSHILVDGQKMSKSKGNFWTL